MIQLTMAVEPYSAVGDSLVTEFKVLIMQRNRVRTRARRPGMASGGMMKLIWKK